MKNFFILFIFVFLVSCPVFAQDYASLYKNQEQADFKLIQNIDPYQENDYLEYAWAPYPLFRSNRTLFYKGGVIDPGYYLLVPREMKGKKYIFFKENGKVKHAVPVYKTEVLAPNFYDQHIPKPVKTKRQKFCDSAKQKFYNHFKGSKQQSPPKSFITTEVVDNEYYELSLYYEQTKYRALFKLKNN